MQATCLEMQMCRWKDSASCCQVCTDLKVRVYEVSTHVCAATTVGRWAKVKINWINVNTHHLTVFWPLPTEQDPTTQTPTLHKLYILYIKCPLLWSMKQKYILYMYLNRAFNK